MRRLRGVPFPERRVVCGTREELLVIRKEPDIIVRNRQPAPSAEGRQPGFLECSVRCSALGERRAVPREFFAPRGRGYCPPILALLKPSLSLSLSSTPRRPKFDFLLNATPAWIQPLPSPPSKTFRKRLSERRIGLPDKRATCLL